MVQFSAEADTGEPKLKTFGHKSNKISKEKANKINIDPVVRIIMFYIFINV